MKRKCRRIELHRSAGFREKGERSDAQYSSRSRRASATSGAPSARDPRATFSQPKLSTSSTGYTRSDSLMPLRGKPRRLNKSEKNYIDNPNNNRHHVSFIEGPIVGRVPRKRTAAQFLGSGCEDCIRNARKLRTQKHGKVGKSESRKVGNTNRSIFPAGPEVAGPGKKMRNFGAIGQHWGIRAPVAVADARVAHPED